MSAAAGCCSSSSSSSSPGGGGGGGGGSGGRVSRLLDGNSMEFGFGREFVFAEFVVGIHLWNSSSSAGGGWKVDTRTAGPMNKYYIIYICLVFTMQAFIRTQHIAASLNKLKTTQHTQI